MKIIADLHIHSRYSRAVSSKMNLTEIGRQAKLKGIDLVGTGDFTHPLWFREIQSELEEINDGLFKLKKTINVDLPAYPFTNSPLFMLQTEISSIYSQSSRLFSSEAKGRRIHNLVYAPSLKTVEKINKELVKRGCNLLSDGRPIIGLTSIELCEAVFGIDERCLIVPAHCLMPDTPIHTMDGIKNIEKIEEGEEVLTHKGRYRKVTEVYARFYEGKLFTIKPWYFRLGLTTTKEHPFLAIKTVKKCRSTGDICRPAGRHLRHCKVKHYKKYKKEWLPAKDLEKGDILIFPRIKETIDKKAISISEYVSGFEKKGDFVKIDARRYTTVKDKIKLNKSFSRLIGYFLAEGYVDSKGGISFAFSGNERSYLEDVKDLMSGVFGLDNFREYNRKNHNGIELIYYSQIVSQFLTRFCYSNKNVFNASTKCIPEFFVRLPKEIQIEVFKGWWRGDKGYTSSRKLANQMKMILLRSGIIPSIGVDRKKEHKERGNHKLDDRNIKANYDNYAISHLAFIEDEHNLTREREFKKFKTKLQRRHGWIDEDDVYLPIRDIKMDKYKGNVYNLEVEEDNSYTAEFACVHNCWTPWYSLYGSKSGFDSVSECFGKYADRIYAIETGLSSDPAMNWRIKELDERAIISSSDAHSGPKLGREVTIFEVKSISYNDIYQAIKTANYQDKTRPRIAGTIEFYPEEGKYHYTGHRKCGVRHSPEETEVKGTACPVCGKGLTVGVMHRVKELAQNEMKNEKGKIKIDKNGARRIFHPENKKPPYTMLVPLLEILAEVLERGLHTQTVLNEYNNLTTRIGPEFYILLQAKQEDIARVSSQKLADAVIKVRSGDIVIQPGFDGEFGKVQIFGEGEDLEKQQEQVGLF